LILLFERVVSIVTAWEVGNDYREIMLNKT
jgi:hypothetical protein